MRKKIFTLVLIIGMCVLSSCSIKQGQDFNESYTSQIKRGKTTKDDIRANIGEPTSVTTTSEGETWIYSYTQGGNYFQNVGAAFGASSFKNQGKELTVIFRGNVVKDFKFRKGNILPSGLMK